MTRPFCLSPSSNVVTACELSDVFMRGEPIRVLVNIGVGMGKWGDECCGGGKCIRLLSDDADLLVSFVGTTGGGRPESDSA